LEIDEVDRALVAATQAGLPLCTRPYSRLATEQGLLEAEVLTRLERLLEAGVIRRIAVVPNHYALGYRANAMSVWDVEDSVADDCGSEIGTLPFVSHCYLRPRRPPRWPYNLFAMVHGRDRSGVEAQIEHIAEILGTRSRGHTALYSKRILKKTGLRLGRAD
jgi:DNA-binding Lrp family transcriptional regulator